MPSKPKNKKTFPFVAKLYHGLFQGRDRSKYHRYDGLTGDDSMPTWRRTVQTMCGTQNHHRAVWSLIAQDYNAFDFVKVPPGDGYTCKRCERIHSKRLAKGKL